MNTGRRRPLSLTNLRAFEAVARRLSFSDAAEELFASIEAHAASVAGVSCPAGASTRIDE